MHSKEKIKKIRNRALLREYINLHLSGKLLEQDDGYYGGYYDDTGVMVGGYSEPGAPASDVVGFLTKSDFARLLGLDSIHNAFKTAVYGLKGIAAKTIGETKILAKSLFWYIMPTFLKSSKFDNIIEMAEQERDKIENQLGNIDREYADVIEKNKEIFENPDLNFAFFVAAPGIVIGKEIVNKSVGASLELFDLLVGRDSTRENLGEQITGFFDNLMTKIGLNPKNYSDRNEVERTIFNKLKHQFPNLSENEFRDIVREAISQRLEEQAEISPEKLQDNKVKIEQFLATREGNAYVKAITDRIQSLMKYIASPQSQQKMNNSAIAKAGQKILATNVVQAARASINRFDMDYIKNNYRNEIENFFNEKGITDPKEKEDMLNDPEVAKEIQKLFKNTLKSAYTKQLDELEKINPSTLKFAVAEGKKLIEAM